jgi:uncharacterized protein (TIGR03437 family)
LLVQRANTYSRPVPLDVGPAQPAIFVVSDSQGHIYRARAEGTMLADSRNPARAGDVLIIYAAGLGAVSPPVADGQPAPSSPLSSLRDAFGERPDQPGCDHGDSLRIRHVTTTTAADLTIGPIHIRSWR